MKLTYPRMPRLGNVAAVILAVVLFAWLTTSPAQGTSYPFKPIRIIAPYATGGNADLNARVLAKKLTESIGQPVIVENRPGGSSIIGTEFVARKAPDGYTVLLVGAGGTTHTTNPALFGKLPYDSIRDFAPVSLFSSVPLIVVVHPLMPVKSLKDLIDLTKGKLGEINAANGGDGTASNLSMQLLMQLSDTKFTLVPYKGNRLALADTIAGNTSVMIDTLSTVLPQVKGRQAAADRGDEPRRLPQLPDVPTVAESGYPSFDMSVYLGVLAPAGTSKETVDRLAQEIDRVTRDSETRPFFAEQATELVSNTPEKFAVFIKNDIAKWEKVIRQAGIKTQ